MVDGFDDFCGELLVCCEGGFDFGIGVVEFGGLGYVVVIVGGEVRL